jgi:hypothetical protein
MLGVPLALVLAAGALVAAVTAVTVAHASDARRLERGGVAVVAEVVDHKGDDTVVVPRYHNGRDVVARAPSDFASEYRRGVRVPIHVDPEDPTRARLAAEPYDATEPITWAAIPLVFAVGFCISRWWSWRRNAATARAGPWWSVSTRRILDGELTTTLGIENHDGDVVCAVRVPNVEPGRGAQDDRLVAAGDAEPGAPIALWDHAGHPIAVSGCARAPEVPVWSVEDESFVDDPVAPVGKEVPADHLIVPLRNYRWASAEPRAEVSDGVVRLFLPAYFGRLPVTTPITNVAVADLTGVEETDAWWNDELLLSRAMSIPYFFTTGPLTQATLLLLFRQPVKVPRLRAVSALAPNIELPFGFFQSRSAEGAHVDGALLRPVAAAEAASALVAAGATRLVAPEEWLRRNRPTLQDPLRTAQLLAQSRRRERLARASNLLCWISVVLAIFAVDDDGSLWPAAVLLAALGGAFTLRVLSRRALRAKGAGV